MVVDTLGQKQTGLFYIFKGCRPQLLAVILGTLNAMSDGMQFGWTSPMGPRLLAADSPVAVTELDITWLEIIYMLAGLVGLPITIYLVDHVGRKRSVLIASFTCVIGWLLIGLANSVVYYYVARFFMGIAADIAFISSPMYIAEVAHQKIRGFLAGIIYLMMLGGILIIYCIGPYLPLYVPPIVGGSILILQLSTFPFMPESPYFLLFKGREEEARQALVKLRGTKEVDDELADMAASIKRQKAEKGRPKDLIMVKSNRKALIIMTVLNGAQHMAGITIMSMNMHSILSAAGSIYIATDYAAIIFSCLMLVATMGSTFVLDMFGRKILLAISTILSGICLLILAVYFNLKLTNVDVSAVSWIPIVCVMTFAVVFKLGLGIIPIVMTAELFPAKTKAMGMAIADGMYIIFSAASVYLYSALMDNFGIHTPFYLFAGCCFFTAIFNMFVIPETKGKTLEEIQMILKGKERIRTSSQISSK